MVVYLSFKQILDGNYGIQNKIKLKIIICGSISG